MSIPYDTPTGTPVITTARIGLPAGFSTQSVPVGTLGKTLGPVSKRDSVVPVRFPGLGEWLASSLDLAIPSPTDAVTGTQPNPFAMLPGLSDQEASDIASQWNDPGTFAVRQMIKQAYALGASRAQAQAFRGIVKERQ